MSKSKILNSHNFKLFLTNQEQIILKNNNLLVKAQSISSEFEEIQKLKIISCKEQQICIILCLFMKIKMTFVIKD